MTPVMYIDLIINESFKYCIAVTPCGTKLVSSLVTQGARCSSSVVRAFDHGSRGRRIDP